VKIGDVLITEHRVGNTISGRNGIITTDPVTGTIVITTTVSSWSVMEEIFEGRAKRLTFIENMTEEEVWIIMDRGVDRLIAIRAVDRDQD